MQIFQIFKILNNKGFQYKFIITDNFAKYTWAFPLKNKKRQTIANKFSTILSTSKRKPLKVKSNRGKEFYNSFFFKTS